MAQQTDVQLTTQSEVIRNEATNKANTKVRVADMIKNLIDSKVNNDVALFPHLEAFVSEDDEIAIDASGKNLCFYDLGTLDDLQSIEVNITGTDNEELQVIELVAECLGTGFITFLPLFTVYGF
jgi:hypothetical protein